ncbi:hypothetical protein NDU88_005899 [Pleurodeles waltl]|uniref:Uncharacterized protein n=1 Tax=Pleurodeles waltl TaxID=8319 RepID=A0AAV7VPJ0_PLEWA|nr:hypothetical protein NDU88_005899 [Pleurodeles waltl]
MSVVAGTGASDLAIYSTKPQGSLSFGDGDCKARVPVTGKHTPSTQTKDRARPDGAPRRPLTRTACRRKHVSEDIQANLEVDRERDEKGDTREERKMNIKQDKEADAFKKNGTRPRKRTAILLKRRNKEGFLRRESKRTSEEPVIQGSYTVPKFQDPETRHVQGGAWLSHVRARLQGSASPLLKRGKQKWGETEKEKGNSYY